MKLISLHDLNTQFKHVSPVRRSTLSSLMILGVPPKSMMSLRLRILQSCFFVTSNGIFAVDYWSIFDDFWSIEGRFEIDWRSIFDDFWSIEGRFLTIFDRLKVDLRSIEGQFFVDCDDIQRFRSIFDERIESAASASSFWWKWFAVFNFLVGIENHPTCQRFYQNFNQNKFETMLTFFEKVY